MRFWRGHKCKATVKRNVQPLVGISRPRIRQFYIFQEMAISWTRTGPQPERPIDMHPCTLPLCHGNHVLKIIERTRADVASLQDNDCGRQTFASKRLLQ